MTNKELGAKIRAGLKAAGYPARSISVRVSDAGYSTAVDVNIKDINIGLSDVRNIVDEFRCVDYDERSGEVLMGGNTYVHVQYDYAMLAVEREKYMELAQGIIDRYQKPFSLIEIAKSEKTGTKLMYSVDECPMNNAAVIYQKDGMRSYYHDRYYAANAYHLAQALAHFKARGSFI